MRLQSVSSLRLTNHGLAPYFIASFRVLHGLTAIAPGVVLQLLLFGQHPSLDANYPAILLFFSLISVLSFQASGVYSEEMFTRRFRFRLMFLSWTASFSFLVFMHQQLGLLQFISLKQLGIWYLLSLLLYGSERLLFLVLMQRLKRKGHYLQNAVILGGTDNGVRIAQFIRQYGDIRLGLIGFIDDRSERVPKELAGLPMLGNSGELERLIREEAVQQVLVALPWSAERRINHVLSKLRSLPVSVLLLPDMIAFSHAHNRITEVAGLPTFNVSELPLRGWSPLLKRIEDLAIASLALLFTAPVMLLIALAIKLDSPGPVFFRQLRYGYNNRLIEVYKFRSMHTRSNDPTAEQQTTRNDSRITRVGQFIRKTSLDELPQLLNVLLGSMSMVGPRPHATATKAAGILFEEAVAEYSARHRVKPGITGWAQVNGYRGETDTLAKIEKRVELDLEYIENWSVWFDLYILFLTVPAVVSTKEAY